MASEIKVDTIVNAGGDNDSGIDLATNDTVKITIAGAEKARVDSSGNFLVGTTSTNPTSSGVNTAGQEFSATGGVRSTVESNPAATLNRKSDDGVLVILRKDGTTIGQINTKDGDVAIGTGDTGLRYTDGSEAITPHNVGTNSGRDNAIDLGSSGARFDDIHATNSSIQTSDQNEKQDIASATTKELNVAKKLSTLFKTFRWKDKVVEKGDKARTHTGIIAQEVQSAFSAEGLDASNYGLFTSDTWTNEEGKEQTRLGVRYPELFSFIFSSIEARLTALESK